jgi:BMFP domain-containing protein YqiC
VNPRLTTVRPGQELTNRLGDLVDRLTLVERTVTEGPPVAASVTTHLDSLEARLEALEARVAALEAP